MCQSPEAGQGLRDLRCAQLAADHHRARARGFFGDPADPFPANELSPDVGRVDPGGYPKHQQMVEHIGTLGDQGVAVAGDRLDQALDGLLAKFLCDLGRPARQQTRRMAEIVGSASRRLSTTPNRRSRTTASDPFGVANRSATPAFSTCRMASATASFPARNRICPWSISPSQAALRGGRTGRPASARACLTWPMVSVPK